MIICLFPTIQNPYNQAHNYTHTHNHTHSLSRAKAYEDFIIDKEFQMQHSKINNNPGTFSLLGYKISDVAVYTYLRKRVLLIKTDTKTNRNNFFLNICRKTPAAVHPFTYKLKIQTMSALFSPFTIRKITLKNRIVIPPMCPYSANNGFALAVPNICLDSST